MMNRRVFLTLLAEGAACFTGASLWAKSTFGKQRRGASIVQGPATESETQINVLVPFGAKWTYTVEEVSTGKQINSSNIQIATHERGTLYKTQNIAIIGLKLDTKYQIIVRDEKLIQVDQRVFMTLDTQKPQLTFALASCLNDRYLKDQQDMWGGLLAQKPDVVFLIGDNVYGDWSPSNSIYQPATPDHLWMRYAQTRTMLDFYYHKTLIPTYTIWDDHDFGCNDGGKDYQYKKESLEIFNQQFPRLNVSNVNYGPGAAFGVELSGVSYFFLDGRSFRETNKNKKGEHLGSVQTKWLIDLLKKNQKPSALIVGDQFFGGYHTFESFEGLHPVEFEVFLAQLRNLKLPIYFMSGDRHCSEIMNIPKKYIGVDTFEITSSGIHSSTFPGSFESQPNPRQIVGIDGEQNFNIIKSQIKASGLELDVSCYGHKLRKFYQRSLALSSPN